MGQPPLALAVIDHGTASKAKLYGRFTREEVRRKFYDYANQCFGIRKSIMKYELVSFEECSQLPDPWGKLRGAEVVLMHNGDLCGDIIVWDGEGNKIKSEWD